MVILKINYNKKLGKNHKGTIISRHKEKGLKSLYIPIDLNYFNHLKSPNMYINLLTVKTNYMYRNTKLILGLLVVNKIYKEFRYLLKPSKKSYGSFIKFYDKFNKQPGDMSCIANFDINDKLYNLEFKPSSKSKLCLAAKCNSTLLNKNNLTSKIKLPSNELKKLHTKCYAIYGSSEKSEINFTQKAGTSRLLGNRPTVRGSAMNACDHPHGGGEGKAPIGKKSIYSFKGKKVKGVKTVKHKNVSYK